jgi:hypothetical protein
MHAQSIPVLVKNLKALSGLLDKGAAFCAEKKVEETVMTNMRLAPDMFPLKRQVYIAGDMAKGAAARLAGVEIPKYEDTEETFEQLKARIAKTIAFMESVSVDAVNAACDKPIEIKLGNGTVHHFTGQSYLNTWVYPNFFFHTTTAYNILRNNGVAIGKSDFLA